MALLLYVIHSRGGVFLVEQPGSSLLWRHPRLKELARVIKASVFEHLEPTQGKLRSVTKLTNNTRDEEGLRACTFENQFVLSFSVAH